ncbi:hypothetical protein Fmac_005849 [Flemingia macrophylla]|uniref:Leucine-rich repeat-containing N-terminal plant-type domain-containing protein n=1 Tax=Flemingia macrophylla TaxID=520843 RepID=A0ABD1N942_9FABA
MVLISHGFSIRVFGDNAFSLPSSAKKMGYALMDRVNINIINDYSYRIGTVFIRGVKLKCDALHSLRTNLQDPNNVLQSWDPTLVNPCTWFHVTCNNDNSVIRVDMGNATLSGQLVPQLGQLKNLQYLLWVIISDWAALLSVLRTTWIYVAQSLGILVPGLLHFLLLLLAQSLAISSGRSTQESEKILQLEQQVRQSREEAHQSREEARQSREQNERLQRQFESLFNAVLPLLPPDTQQLLQQANMQPDNEDDQQPSAGHYGNDY